jgi:carboxynorspermidine decarboxylase
MLSPAFIFDDRMFASRCETWRRRCVSSDVSQLFPLKCNSLGRALRTIANHVDGFAVSSLFEARLAREYARNDHKIHFTSPGLRADEIDAILDCCDGVTFNSLSQWRRHKLEAAGAITCGLRINPQLSLVRDSRYDPSREGSKLGVPLQQIEGAIESDPALFDGIEGIHFHTNCDSTDWSPLLATVSKLADRMPNLLHQCRWINFGGGYLLEDDTDLSKYWEAIRLVKDRFDLEVILEPGASISREAGTLVSTVVDIFESAGSQIAVLDTTVNHLPEVFEYQYVPDVQGDVVDGEYCYILAGSSCLSGDIFGEYAFRAPLQVGSKITFLGAGAYTIVKSHMFNGINLPAVYFKTLAGQLELQNTSDYTDFRKRCGAESHEIV